MSDQRKKCQRIDGRAVKRGPYPKPMRERVDYVFANEKAHGAALWRHKWYRHKVANAMLRETVPNENRLDVA